MTFILRLILMYFRARIAWQHWPNLPPDGDADGADVPDSHVLTDVHHTEAYNANEGAEFEADSPSPSPAPAAAPERTIEGRYCWCINAGHGSLQPGKRSPVIPELGDRFYEWKWNRMIKDMIIEELEYLGISFFDVVPENNVDDFLVERVARANNHPSLLPKVYLSIHANAGPASDLDTWSEAEGTETWYYHGSRLGRNLASIFNHHLVAATGFRNRHLRSKVAGQFYELRKTEMVSVLTESGFYNNRREVMELIKPEVMRNIAKAHIAAILEVEENGL